MDSFTLLMVVLIIYLNGLFSRISRLSKDWIASISRGSKGLDYCKVFKEISTN